MTDRMLRSCLDPEIAIDPDEVGRVVEEVFAEALGVWIYGSFATGHARRDSDLDIAVLADRPIDRRSLAVGHDAIAMRLRPDIHLVDLRELPPLLRFEVFAKGRRVAAREPVSCAFFETMAVSQYQRLNIERAALFDEIRQRALAS